MPVDGPSAVRAARELARHTLEVWGLGTLSDTVLVIVSELVTNAVVHTAGLVWLEIERRRGAVRVTVMDHDPRLPKPRRVPLESVSGRGLLLVEALAQSWGTCTGEAGKAVWADISLDA